MRTSNRYFGRKAQAYTGGLDVAKALLRYDPATGEMRTIAGYNVRPRISQHGHHMIRVPVSLKAAERGFRQCDTVRVDHMAWYLTMEVWPTGWIEHINGLLQDDAMENLVHRTEEGARWWYGPQTVGGAPQLVEVESTYRDDGYEGPLIYQRTLRDGKIQWVPQVKPEHRISMSDGTSVVIPEDVQYEKGEWGVDWGYGTDRPNG